MDEFPAAGSFAHVVGECLVRSGYNACQVARLAGLPRRTVANWHDGVVTKPRNWLDVVKLARALRLPRNEANKLLAAAATHRWLSCNNKPKTKQNAACLPFGQKPKLRLKSDPLFRSFPIYPPLSAVKKCCKRYRPGC
jgi:hypothetical protein